MTHLCRLLVKLVFFLKKVFKRGRFLVDLDGKTKHIHSYKIKKNKLKINKI